MTPEFATALTARLITSLSEPDRPWFIGGDERIVGPGTIALALRDPGEGDFHAHIGIQLNRDRPDAPVLIDCVAGVGGSPDEAAEHAMNMWLTTTWAATLELLSQTGQHAAHFGEDHEWGIDGWHVILSPIVRYGLHDASAERLQGWLADAGPAAVLGRAVSEIVEPGPLHGVKLLLGGDPDGRTAEVRIDGEYAKRASEHLFALDWPTPSAFSLVRCYAILISHGHRNP